MEEDLVTFRKTFYEALYNDEPEYDKIYSMLHTDKFGDMINYPKIGVEYMLRSLKLLNKTLTQIFILRTTREQHEKVIALVDDMEQGFFLECKRLVIEAAHLNRGVITFMRHFGVNEDVAVCEFFKVPLQHRVINVKHAVGLLDPVECFHQMETTVRRGMTAEAKKLDHGHDIVQFKRVKIAYMNNMCVLENLSLFCRDKPTLISCGVKAFSKNDAFKLFY